MLVPTAGVADAEADTAILPMALGAGMAGGLLLIKGGGLLLTLATTAGVAVAADSEDADAGKISSAASTTCSEDSEAVLTAAAFLLGLQQRAFESPLNPATVSSGLMSVRQTGHREALRSHGCTQEAWKTC